MSRHKRRRVLEQFSTPSQGIYDTLARPAEDQFKEEEEEDESTVPDFDPIDPSPQMAVQLSVAEPPVDDDEFVPGSVEELANASSILARVIPDGEIEWFYRQLHKLVDEANDRDLDSSEEEIEEVQEESAKKIIRRTLHEILTDDDDEDEYDEFRTGGIDYFGAEDLEPPDEPQSSPDEGEGMSLEDLADEFGYSGAPGVRQEINRITDKLKYFASKVKNEDFDALLKYAAAEYVDTLEATGALDAEDLSDLRAASNIVEGLDSFRYFFVAAFILPAYKAVSKEATKKLKATIDELGLPKALNQTVLNQAAGGARKNPALIRKKLMKLADDGQIDVGEVDDIANKIRSSLPALERAADLSDDLIEKSLDRWQSTSKKKRASLLNQAMDQTAEG